MSVVHPSRWDRLRVAAVLRASADPGPYAPWPHDRDRWLQTAAAVERQARDGA